MSPAVRGEGQGGSAGDGTLWVLICVSKFWANRRRRKREPCYELEYSRAVAVARFSLHPQLGLKQIIPPLNPALDEAWMQRTRHQHAGAIARGVVLRENDVPELARSVERPRRVDAAPFLDQGVALRTAGKGVE